jgi:hypothetical protein
MTLMEPVAAGLIATGCGTPMPNPPRRNPPLWKVGLCGVLERKYRRAQVPRIKMPRSVQRTARRFRFFSRTVGDVLGRCSIVGGFMGAGDWLIIR